MARDALTGRAIVGAERLYQIQDVAVEGPVSAENLLSEELRPDHSTDPRVDDLIARALSELRAESARSEAKAATLLTVTGVALTILLAVGTAHHSRIASGFTWAATIAVAAAVVQLLIVVRPWGLTRSPHRYAFGFYARLNPGTLVEIFEQDIDRPAEFRMLQLERLKKFSWRVNSKYRLIRYATDCMLMAVVLVIAAGLSTLVT